MVEIAILAVSNGNIVEQYQTLVNPGIPISPGAYSTHGISDADVASAPKAESIAADIAERLRGKTVVGHNVTFDLAFIETAFRDAGITEKLFYIDTHSFSRKLFPTFPKYGLQDLLSLLHIERRKRTVRSGTSFRPTAYSNAVRTNGTGRLLKQPVRRASKRNRKRLSVVQNMQTHHF